MIMDYFDESLVLLKRLLCWEIDDILYVKLNERKDNEKATRLSGRVHYNIRRWNKADVLLFNYFNATFWKKSRKGGFRVLWRPLRFPWKEIEDSEIVFWEQN